MSWLKEVVGTERAVIAMCRLRALPGGPSFDAQLGMNRVIDKAWDGLVTLQNGGVDAVMFSNEFSFSYFMRVCPETAAAMARIIRQLMNDIRIPFSVNVLWDPVASFDLAMVTGAKLIREILTGVYASGSGVWDTNVGETIRHQYRIGAGEVKALFNIVPETVAYLSNRDICSIAKLIVSNNYSDALCVSGLTAGTRIGSALLKRVKETVPDTVVLANTGVCLENVEEQPSIVDDCVTATTFKKDGVFANFVDQARISQFTERVHHIRRQDGDRQSAYPWQGAIILLQSLPPSPRVSIGIVTRLTRVGTESTTDD